MSIVAIDNEIDFTFRIATIAAGYPIFFIMELTPKIKETIVDSQEAAATNKYYDKETQTMIIYDPRGNKVNTYIKMWYKVPFISPP